jgi:hypothetical protein
MDCTRSSSDQQEPTASMADSILALVQERDWVSFAEITNDLARLGFPAAGDRAMELAGCPNVFLWAGISGELLAAIKILLTSRRVFLHAASPFVYMIDGHYPTWPIAKRPPAKGYASPHWLPVCFRVVPSQQSRRAS